MSTRCVMPLTVVGGRPPTAGRSLAGGARLPALLAASLKSTPECTARGERRQPLSPRQGVTRRVDQPPDPLWGRSRTVVPVPHGPAADLRVSIGPGPSAAQPGSVVIDVLINAVSSEDGPSIAHRVRRSRGLTHQGFLKAALREVRMRLPGAHRSLGARDPPKSVWPSAHKTVLKSAF